MEHSACRSCRVRVCRDEYLLMEVTIGRQKHVCCTHGGRRFAEA